MTTKTNTYSVTLTKSKWNEVKLGLLDRYDFIMKSADITDELRNVWMEDLLAIFDEIDRQTCDCLLCSDPPQWERDI